MARYEKIVAVIFVALFFLGGSVFVCTKYAALGYNAIDLGIFHQVVANTAHGRFFALSIHPPSYFGDHVSPLLLAVVPFYLLLPRPETLLVLQVLALALGAVPLFLLAQRLSPPLRLVIILAYVLSPLIQNFSAFEFELLVFAIPLLLAALVAYERKCFSWFLFWCTGAAMIREDVGLVLLGLGVYAWINRRSWRWRIAPIVIGLITFFGGMIVTGSINHEQYKFFVYYSWMGPSVHEALRFLLTHPWMIVAQVLRPQNILFVLTLLLLSVGIPLLRARRLVPSVFVLAALLLMNTGGDDITLRTHYPALLVPFLFWALIGGLERCQTHPPRWIAKIFDTTPATALALFVLGVSLYGTLTMGAFRPAAVASVIRDNNDPRVLIGKELKRSISPASGIATSYAFLPFFGRHETLASLNYVFTGHRQFSQMPYVLPEKTDIILYDTTDYLMYDVQYGSDAETFQGGDNRFRSLLRDRGFVLTDAVDSFLLFRRQSTDAEPALYSVGTTANRSLPRATDSQLSLIATSAEQNFRVEPFTVRGTTVSTIPLSLTWQLLASTETTYHLRVEYVDSHGVVHATKSYALGYGILPTTEWPSGVPVTVRYRWIVPKLPSGTYHVRVAAESIKGYLTLDAKLTAVLERTTTQDAGPVVTIGSFVQP
ncbi:MAG: DUF2079 domain-containing protein [bacterium]